MMRRRRRPLLRGAALAPAAPRWPTTRARAARPTRIKKLRKTPRAKVPPSSAAPRRRRRRGRHVQSSIDELKQLGQLHEQGVLTDEEFAAQKAKVLDG